jgi:methylated-DNA-[protein]-cysteine S-methyltransferase
MEAIVESKGVTVVRTRYDVPGWGTGELWSTGHVVLAHEFEFGEVAVAVMEAQGRASHLGTTATFLDTRPDLALRSHSASDVEASVISRVRRHLAGEAVLFDDVALDLDWCTDFQRAVLEVVRALPRGEVAAYGEVAALAGSPGAGRAVGTVCAQNRFALFVPCHRVVSATGIGSYGSAGLEVKRRLLALEGVVL